MKKKSISIILIVVLLLAALFFGYTGNYYHCTDRDEALESTSDVSVEKTDYGYFFDGPGTDKCLIFYPGGLVEDIAYADLMKKIAGRGYDCALVHMPFNLAVFASSKADKVRKEYDYSKWYIGGHSLGGAMAANYCADSSYKYDGLILLAAYPTKNLAYKDFSILSVYGSEDGVVNREKLLSNKTAALMPNDYIIKKIDGGNHGHFGNYGHQKGDGRATITNEKQQQETAALIAETFGN